MKSLLIIALLILGIGTQAQNVGINTTTPQAALDVQGDVILRNVNITLVNGANENVNLSTVKSAHYSILGPNSVFEIGGFTGGIDGRIISLYNPTPFLMTIKHLSSGSDLANQINTGSGIDFVLSSYSAVTFRYQTIDNLWHVQASHNVWNTGGTTNNLWAASGTNISNTNTSNVGIGIANPTSKLDILDASTTNVSALHVFNSSATGNGVFSSSNGGLGVYGESGGVNGVGGSFFTFGGDPNSKALKAETFLPGTIAAYFTAPSGNALITDQGNVGVGFTSGVVPRKFTVRESGIGIAQEALAGGPQIGFYTSSNGAYLQTHNNYDLLFATSNSGTPMVLQKETGNLGIGTTNPTARLSVTRGNSTSAFDGTAAFAGTTHVSHFNYGTAEDTYIRGGKDNGRVFLADNLGGAVGIGTTNTAGYKLAVNGKIRSKELVVNSGWADYVFSNNHKLLPLNEVEKFILTNKHLPNIPSAEEVEKNGLKVGEMQTKMMEKIEELTLYMIEANKKIEKLEAEIIKLKLIK